MLLLMLIFELVGNGGHALTYTHNNNNNQCLSTATINPLTVAVNKLICSAVQT